MNIQAKLLIGLIVVVLALGAGLSLSQRQADVKPSWVNEVQWSYKPDNAEKIENLLWAQISPYRTEYMLVNISSPDGKGLRLRLIATSKDSNNPDIYDFTYEEDKLLLTGYLLEAIPQAYRNDAIGIALEDREVAASAAGSGSPTVRRVLPVTSRKFYAPKTLLSVTWEGISALVDPDDKKVVKVWKAGTSGYPDRG